MKERLHGHLHLETRLNQIEVMPMMVITIMVFRMILLGPFGLDDIFFKSYTLNKINNV